MTVGELITILQNYDHNMVVVVDGYEGGFDNPTTQIVDIVLNSNWTGKEKAADWSGRHDYFDDIFANFDHTSSNFGFRIARVNNGKDSTKALVVGRCEEN